MRVTPNAGGDQIMGVETRDDGQSVLAVRVRAVADKGKANKAVILALAKHLDVKQSAISLVRGQTARLKTLKIAENTPQLRETLQKMAQKPA